MIQRSMQPSCRIHRCTLFSQPTSSEIGSATIAPEPLNSCGNSTLVCCGTAATTITSFTITTSTTLVLLRILHPRTSSPPTLLLAPNLQRSLGCHVVDEIQAAREDARVQQVRGQREQGGGLQKEIRIDHPSISIGLQRELELEPELRLGLESGLGLQI